MISAIIIEDEKPAARRLNKLVSQLDIKVLKTLHSVSEAINWFANNKQPELLFLDIQLSDGLSFEIFEHIQLKSAIIFTTAYDEYALKAFKLNSVDYLLKPIDQSELETAVQKFKMQTKPHTYDLEMIKNLFLDNMNQQDYKERFTVKVGDHIKLFQTSSIQCFYSHDKATYLVNELGKTYVIDQSLDELNTQLNPEQFFKISRKFIVNISFIKELVSYSNSRLRVVLKAKLDEIPIVSREKVKDFKNWIN